MPYPVGHVLFAAALAQAALPREAPRRNVAIALAGLASVAPDFDFALVWWLELGREWHRGFTHSIPFALGVGALCLAVAGRRYARECAVFTLALLSHGLLDFASSMQSAGVALFWPFSNERFGLGYTGMLEPQATVVTLRDAIAAGWRSSIIEAAVFLPLLGLVWLARRKISRKDR
jgi:inner membrane protein